MTTEKQTKSGDLSVPIEAGDFVMIDNNTPIRIEAITNTGIVRTVGGDEIGMATFEEKLDDASEIAIYRDNF